MKMHLPTARFLLYHIVLSFLLGATAVPQTLTSVEWQFSRKLYNYRMYGAVSLERISLPSHVVSLNFSVNAFSNSDSCDVKDVNIFANQFGIPVVSRDNESFPKDTFVPKAPVLNMTISTHNRTVSWILTNLEAGNLFFMAVMPNPDTRIKQKGLGVSCKYFISMESNISYYDEAHIPVLTFDGSQKISFKSNSKYLYRIQIPSNAVSYTVEIQGCETNACPLYARLFETLRPNMWTENMTHCQWQNGNCAFRLFSPKVDSQNYILMMYNGKDSLSMYLNASANFCETHSQHSNYSSGKELRENSTCSFIATLGRETPSSASEASNFYDRFTVWNTKTLAPEKTISIKVHENTDSVLRFNLLTIDTGASVNLGMEISVDKERTEDFSVDFCVVHSKIENTSDCVDGAKLLAKSEEKQNKKKILIPYPESGAWYISLNARCFKKGNNFSSDHQVTCLHPPVANLSVKLSSCVDGQCGDHGSCKLYFSAEILYSACQCVAGWRGFGCNDGRKALNALTQRVAVYLLTFSNLGFIPGICLALYRKFYIEALVYSYNMFFSTFYHACDASSVYRLCILPYNSLSFADFFASLMSFSVTLLAMARITKEQRSFLHLLAAIFIALGEVHNRHGLLEQLLPITCSVGIVVISWGYEMFKRKGLFPSKQRYLKFIIPGLAMASLGLIVNLAVETQDNYKYVHSLWHILVSGAILFLLPPRLYSKKESAETALSIQSGDITRNGLTEGSPQANLNSADDFNDDYETSVPGTMLSVMERGIRLVTRNKNRNQNLVL